MAVKPSDTLSSDFTSVEDLFDSGTVEAEAAEEVEDVDQSDESIDQDPVPHEQSEDSHADDGEESSEAEEIWEIKANGKVHKIDPKNQDEVKRLLSFGLGARPAFTRLAKANQEIRRLTEEVKQSASAKEKAALFDKLEAVKDDENELFRLITGGRSLDDVVKARVEKMREWESLDPVERIQREKEEETAQLIARIERMEKAAQRERELAEQASREAQEKKTYSSIYPEFQKIFKQLKISDPVESQETAADLWSLGWDRIQRLAAQAEAAGKPLELTPEFAARQFAAVAKRWGYSVQKAAKQEVTKILDKKSKNATKRAGMAATRNYKSAKLDNLDGLSPTRRFEKLFGR